MQPTSALMRELAEYSDARSQWFGLVSVVWFAGYALGEVVGPGKIALRPRPGYPEGQFLEVKHCGVGVKN